jgi:hypothetical protein
MSNTSKSKRPKPVRVPPHAAAGLDDELTAQPRPPSDELGSAVGGEAGLSLEPEDMGTRWLSQATEQGEAVPRTRLESELTLTTGPDTDAVLMPPNFAHENTVWEQTVDLMEETKGAADQLRGPMELEDDAPLSEQELAPDAARDLSVTDASVREFSLLDRVNEAGDDTIAPDIQSEEVGRHARTAPPRAGGRRG